MQQRSATGDCDYGRAQRTELVDAAKHFFRWHRLRKIVELVAVGAGQVAAPHGNNVSQQRMLGRGKSARSHGCSAAVAVERLGAAAQDCKGGWHYVGCLLITA